jgi:hypothetical protein
MMDHFHQVFIAMTHDCSSLTDSFLPIGVNQMEANTQSITSPSIAENKHATDKEASAQYIFHHRADPTWGDLALAIKDAEFNYGMGYLAPPEPDWIDQPISNTVIAYWVPGGSEGHWVHVHALRMNAAKTGYDLSPIIIALKFLTDDERKDAEHATNFILECVNDGNLW